MRQKRSCMRITGGDGDIFMDFLIRDYDADTAEKGGVLVRDSEMFERF